MTTASSDHKLRPDYDAVWYHSTGEPMHRDREGTPISLRHYGELMGDPEYRIVAHTAVGDQAVITAWSGIDQGRGISGETPLIFGTLVTERGRAVREVFSATEGEARQTHTDLVAELVETSGLPAVDVDPLTGEPRPAD